MLKIQEEIGWFILNRNIERDQKGEYIRSLGEKGTVIDDVIVEAHLRKIKKLEVN